MNTIIDYFITVEERDTVMNFLDKLDEVVFDTGIKVDEFIHNNAESRWEALLLQYFTQEAQQDRQLLKNKIISLQNELNNLKVITITVVSAPKSETIINNHNYIKSFRTEPFLLEYKVNPKLIGGAVIEANGRVSEFSFRRYFDKHKIGGNLYGF